MINCMAVGVTKNAGFWSYFDVNILKTMRIHELASEGVMNFIHLGSYFEYGGDRISKNGEEYNIVDPKGDYATTKAASSLLLRQWAESNNVSILVLRLFHVYGEGERIADFIHQ